MNAYEFLISKLKAMQVQGYPQSAIINEWKKGLPDSVISLNQSLFWAVIKGNTAEIKDIKTKLNKIKTLDKPIKTGLLE